jgi:hypothetical protein
MPGAATVKRWRSSWPNQVFVTTGTIGLYDPTTSRHLPKAAPDGNDEGMTHTAPSEYHRQIAGNTTKGWAL